MSRGLDSVKGTTINIVIQKISRRQQQSGSSDRPLQNIWLQLFNKCLFIWNLKINILSMMTSACSTLEYRKNNYFGTRFNPIVILVNMLWMQTKGLPDASLCHLWCHNWTSRKPAKCAYTSSHSIKCRISNSLIYLLLALSQDMELYYEL